MQESLYCNNLPLLSDIDSKAPIVWVLIANNMWKAVLQVAVATVLLLHAAHGKCMLHAILFCIQYYSASSNCWYFCIQHYGAMEQIVIKFFAFSIIVQAIIIVKIIFAFSITVPWSKLLLNFLHSVL